MSDVIIRAAVDSDAAQLAEIYRYYTEKTAISFEYDAPDVAEMARRMKAVQKKYPYLVAEEDGKILGYTYAHPFVGRAAYDWSVEMTIYLAPDVRHKGIGKRLYQTMEKVLKAMGVLNLNSCIGYPRVEDQYLTKNSVEFHLHMGYDWVGLFHNSGYKFGRWYDMVWMEKIIGEHRTPAAPVKPFDEVRGQFGL